MLNFEDFFTERTQDAKDFAFFLLKALLKQTFFIHSLMKALKMQKILHIYFTEGT